MEPLDDVDLAAASAALGLDADKMRLDDLSPMISGLLEAYQYVEAEPDHLPNTDVQGREFTIPGPEENPHNAWFLRTSLRDEGVEGKLSGYKLALKDSVMLGGVPMRNGSRELEGFRPAFDATIVRRILAAGGEIIGKTECEYFCLSGGSHTGSAGPVLNPHRDDRAAGGSSSGSAVVVSTGEADMAIGADQAGSIRMPASFSGVVGLKPTYGLVPYTGIAPIEPHIDHVGPMSSTVRENALLLEIIAGPDGADPRQSAGTPSATFTDWVGRGVDGLRVGVLAEGFGHENSEPDVDSKVREAAEILARLGAEVTDVSVPDHVTGPAVWAPIALDGLTHTVAHTQGFGVGRDDVFAPDYMQRLFERRGDLGDLPDHILVMMLASESVRLKRGYSLYGKAVNLARRLRAAYDEALTRVDLLLMPSTPMKATPLPPPDASAALSWQRATEMFTNTCPFNVSHHPAISIPCGMSDGLPIGLMLVGRHFDEATIYRAAGAFESEVRWAER